MIRQRNISVFIALFLSLSVFYSTIYGIGTNNDVSPTFTNNTKKKKTLFHPNFPRADISFLLGDRLFKVPLSIFQLEVEHVIKYNNITACKVELSTFNVIYILYSLSKFLH